MLKSYCVEVKDKFVLKPYSLFKLINVFYFISAPLDHLQNNGQRSCFMKTFTVLAIKFAIAIAFSIAIICLFPLKSQNGKYKITE